MDSQRQKRKKTKEKRCIECGHPMHLTTLRDGDIEYEGYQCPACGTVVLTLEQMKAYRLRALRQEVSENRKVVRIGNSLGVTLPSALSKLGIKEGREVKVILLDEENIQLSFIK